MWSDLLAELEPTTFYRVEKVDRKTKNDGAWMNFPSVSLFSSAADASLSTFLSAILGCETSTNAYSITGSTPLVDSLLSPSGTPSTDQEQATGRWAGRFWDTRGGTWLYENAVIRCRWPLCCRQDVEDQLDSGLRQPRLCAERPVQPAGGGAPVLVERIH